MKFDQQPTEMNQKWNIAHRVEQNGSGGATRRVVTEGVATLLPRDDRTVDPVDPGSHVILQLDHQSGVAPAAAGQMRKRRRRRRRRRHRRPAVRNHRDAILIGAASATSCPKSNHNWHQSIRFQLSIINDR